MNPSSLRDNKGFTLLELIVVMVLIGIVTSFTVPRIADFLFADQLKGTVRKLVGLINQTSLLAQQRQVSYLLTYDAGQHRFKVEPEQQEEAGKDAGERIGGLPLARSVTVKYLWSWYGGTRSAKEFVIRFSKNGYIEPTIIHLQEEGGDELSVVLSPFLGKVRIVDSAVAPDPAVFFQ
jgi:general secretion pathway protein H